MQVKYVKLGKISEKVVQGKANKGILDGKGVFISKGKFICPKLMN